MKKLTVKKEKWYNFDIDKVNNAFTGGFTFINEFCVKNNYNPSAVYKVKTPDKLKGHKKYALITKIGSHTFISGMSQAEINKWRYQHAIICLSCNTLLYSINRHHFHGCNCSNNTIIDGGREYLRYLGKDLKLIKPVIFDLLTNKVVRKNAKSKKKTKKK